MKKRVELANLLVEAITRFEAPTVVRQFSSLLSNVERSDSDRISTQAAKIVFDLTALQLSNFDVSRYGVDYHGVMRNSIYPLSKPQTISKLLSHPGTVNEPREHVLLTLDDEKQEADSTDKTKLEPPLRRFRSLHEAAAWIQENWPDFDLETNHPVTWHRNER